MQGFSYSIFSIFAIVIHLIFNFKFLAGRGLTTRPGNYYRGFLFGVLAYYIADGAWGVFAGLRWRGLWYVDTIFFFLSLPVFIFMWCRFVIVYLDFDKRASRLYPYQHEIEKLIMDSQKYGKQLLDYRGAH